MRLLRQQLAGQSLLYVSGQTQKNNASRISLLLLDAERQNMLPESCDNAFAGRIVLQGHQSITIAVLNFLMMPCTLVANIIVIAGLCRTRQLGTTVNNLFLCLSITDACIAVVVQTLVGVLFTFFREKPMCGLEVATQFLTFLFGHASGFTIVAVGIDRYVHMKYLQKYNAIMTRTRAKIMIGVSFTSAIGMGLAYTLSTVYNKYQWVNMIILLADLSAVIIIYVAYIEAYSRVKKHVKSTRGLRKGAKNAPSYAMSMITTILLILGAVFVCYVPYVIAGTIGFYQVQIKGRILSRNTAFLIYLTYLLVYLNSCLNAVIFIYKNDPVRKFFLGALCYRWKPEPCTPGNSTDSVQLSTIKSKNKVTSSCESLPTVTSSKVDLLSYDTAKE